MHEFNRIFFGENNDGLDPARAVDRRSGACSTGLSKRHALCIFTGRLQYEAQITLSRFVPDFRWSMIVADDNVAKSKPAPDGLLDISARTSGPADHVRRRHGR